MYDETVTIRQFLDAAAAKQPTPGGGSVTALVGALAASMGEMVVNYSVGKKGLEPHQADLTAGLNELHRARQLLLRLMVEDQAAYEALTAAKKPPEASSERQTQLAAALLGAIGTPQAIGAAAVAILTLCDRLVDKVNPTCCRTWRFARTWRWRRCGARRTTCGSTSPTCPTPKSGRSTSRRPPRRSAEPAC